MSQAGFSKILIYKSDTATSVPSAANMTNSATGAELAVNTADLRLFTKNSGGSVVELGTNPSSLTLPNGTANGVLYLNGSKAATSGSAVTYDGTTFGTTGAANFATSSGNVGIGTSSPDQKLVVSGQQRVLSASQSFTSSGKGLEIFYNSGDDIGYVQSYDRAGGAYKPLTIRASQVNFTSGTGANTLLFDSSGNLGLGVTPNAWSGFKALQISSGLSAWSSGVSNARINANTYYNGGYKYIGTGTATMYEQDGYHAWYTAPSGTAGNAITFTQAMTLDASGNLGVGTTSPSTLLTVSGANTAARGQLSIVGASASPRITLYEGSTFYAAFAASGTDAYIGTESNTPFRFLTNGSERARITSGGAFLIGTTTQIGAGLLSLSFDTGTYCGITTQPTNNAGYDAARFRNSSGTQIGSISCTGADTAYNTSSDRRLKENIQPAADAGFVIDAIEVIKHDWKSGGHIRYGVIAQDLHAVVPEAVKAGDDGEEVTDVWGVDYSKLVPMLVKEIQSLRARVAQLENK